MNNNVRNIVFEDRVLKRLTLGFLKPVDEEFHWVFRLVDYQTAHHVLKDLVESLLFDVFFATSLKVNLLLFQHHFALMCYVSNYTIIVVINQLSVYVLEINSNYLKLYYIKIGMIESERTSSVFRAQIFIVGNDANCNYKIKSN